MHSKMATDEKRVDLSKRKKKNKRGKRKYHDDSKVDANTLNYYKAAQSALAEGFPSEEEREIFLDNVIKQLTEDLPLASQDKAVSTIIEEIILLSSKSHCLNLLQAFSSDWKTPCIDRFASHVVETLLLKSASLLSGTKQDEEMFELFIQFHHEIMDQLGLFVTDTFGSHIIRTWLQILGGCRIEERMFRKQSKGTSPEAQKTKPTDALKLASHVELEPAFFEICETLTKLPKVKEFLKTNLPSMAYQTMLLVVQVRCPALLTEMCSILIKGISLNEFQSADKDSLPEMVTHITGSCFVQQLINVLPAGLYNDVLSSFKERIPAMIGHSFANYVLQGLIKQAASKEQFIAIYDAVIPHLEDVRIARHFGILLELLEGCIKYKTKQKNVVREILKAFHCPEDKVTCIAQVLLSLSTYESLCPENGGEPQLKQILFYGSKILQLLVTFSDPLPYVKSITSLSSKDLSRVACDRIGSWVIQSILDSPSVAPKNLSELFEKFKGGGYMILACSPSGSRVFDTLWSKATVKQRTAIAKELVQSETQLKGNKFALFVWRKCSLDYFKTRPDQWKDGQSEQSRKRKNFEDIFTDHPQSSNEGKKTKFDSNDSIDDGMASQKSHEEVIADVNPKKGSGKNQKNKSLKTKQIKGKVKKIKKKSREKD